MKKFNKLFEVGTSVKIEGVKGWHKVKAIHDSRHLIEVKGLVGSFQRGHIVKFTNKKG